METGRLETFADGVFAIAATLLVLDVTVELPAHGHLAHELWQIWPSYVGYAVSFLTIGIMWVNHHFVLKQIAIADRTFLFLNVFLLMCIAFVPFPTRLLAETIRTDDGRAAAVAYGVTMTVTAVFFNAMWRYAISREGHLLEPDADPGLIRSITHSFRPGIPSYAAATAVSFVSAWAGAALYAGIALFYVLTGALFGREESVQ
jgi:TMEM175 potassium channel family protein